MDLEATSAHWREVPFGTLYAAPSRNGIYKPTSFHGRGCRIVNMGEMFGYDFIADQEMNCVELTPSETAVWTLEDGDLLFGRRSVVESGAGKCSLVVGPRSPITFESSIIRARLRTDQALPLFFYYYFQSPPGRRRIRGIVSGTNVKGIRGSELRDLNVPVPTISEQKAIAAALSDVDALLGALDRLIAKKRDLKQAAMQQLLTGQTRLPGFSGKWETKRLGDIAHLKNGFAFPSSIYLPLGNFKVVTIANVQDGYMDTADCSTVSELPRELQAHQRLRQGDLLISMTGNVGRVCRVTEDNCLLNQRVGKLIPSGADDGFLFFLLGQRTFLNAMTGKAKGGAQGNLSIVDIVEHMFPVPPTRTEQRAIAEVLRDMDAELTALEQRRDKTHLLKQGMMQELLTGRTRLV